MCNTAKSTVEVKNFRGAYEACQDAIESCRPYIQGNVPTLPPHQPKPKGTQFNPTQLGNDQATCRKLCKASISEVDFNNLQGCAQNLI